VYLHVPVLFVKKEKVANEEVEVVDRTGITEKHAKDTAR